MNYDRFIADWNEKCDKYITSSTILKLFDNPSDLELVAQTIGEHRINMMAEPGNNYNKKEFDLKKEILSRYSREHIKSIDLVGFIESKIPDYKGWIGDIIDGFTGEKSMIQIELNSPEKHRNFTDESLSDKEHIAIQSKLWITEKQRCEYLSFCPSENKSLKTVIVNKDTDFIARIKQIVDTIIKAVKEFISLKTDRDIDNIKDQGIKRKR